MSITKAGPSCPSGTREEMERDVNADAFLRPLGHLAKETIESMGESTYGFQRTATGRIVLRADKVERGLLTSVAQQVIDLVKTGGNA
jgi:hypothetical protein